MTGAGRAHVADFSEVLEAVVRLARASAYATSRTDLCAREMSDMADAKEAYVRRNLTYPTLLPWERSWCAAVTPEAIWERLKCLAGNRF